MTHDESMTGNVQTLVKYMQDRESYHFLYFCNEERKNVKKGKLSSTFFLLFVKPFLMAGAEFILMDNGFLPMAFFDVRKETTVIQLWHGTGSVKKFGQDSNKGRLKELEKRINKNIDFLTVNAKSQIEQYAKAFGISKDKVVVTGLPRTDWLMRMREKETYERNRASIREKVGKFLGKSIDGKKILLYAPTFRDEEGGNPKLHIDIKRFLEALPETILLGIRLHPFVAKFYEEKEEERILNLSFYEDLNELLVLSDALLTDYSSLIFDYVILDKPMFFLTDDLEDFSLHGRGFYLDYKKDLPGLWVEEEVELAKKIERDLKEEPLLLRQKREAFLKRYYEYLDGNSAERVYETCIIKKN